MRRRLIILNPRILKNGSRWSRVLSLMPIIDFLSYVHENTYQSLIVSWTTCRIRLSEFLIWVLVGVLLIWILLIRILLIGILLVGVLLIGILLVIVGLIGTGWIVDWLIKVHLIVGGLLVVWLWSWIINYNNSISLLWRCCICRIHLVPLSSPVNTDNDANNYSNDEYSCKDNANDEACIIIIIIVAIWSVCGTVSPIVTAVMIAVIIMAIRRHLNKYYTTIDKPIKS